MSVRIDSDPTSSAPSQLFDGTARRVDLANYDAMPDGERFAVIQPDAAGPGSVVVVENRLAEIQP